MLAEAAHAKGKHVGLRLPQIWRQEADRFFAQNSAWIRAASFDAFLVRQFEAFGFLKRSGLLSAQGAPEIVLDSTIYDLNGFADAMLSELFGTACGEENGGGSLWQRAVHTFPLELNARELAEEGKRFFKEGLRTELIVYGRIPMMVSAQCIRKTSLNCDKRPSLMFLGDRTGARLPVRNCCRFCYNVIFNSQPTVLYDLREELRKIPHETERFEFTTERPDEVKEILSLKRIPKEMKFTRGYFRRGVQ